MSGIRARKRTIFHSTLIAIALSNVQSEKAMLVGCRIATFLGTYQSIRGTWNYWNPSSGEFTQEPYPDDLDDTSSAIAAISLFAPDSLSGTDYANFTKELCMQETDEGGPYRTWCIPNDSAHDRNEVDIGVNAAIGYALSLHGIKLKGLDAYIEKEIEEDRIASKYYCDEVTLIYLISRWYRGEHAPIMIRKLYKRLEDISARKEPVILAMTLTSLARLGESKEKLRNYAGSLAQEMIRGPRAYGMYIEKIEKDKAWYSGGGALTAALCAESLSLFGQKETGSFGIEDAIYERICEACCMALSENPLPTDTFEKAIEYGLGKEDMRGIALFPYHAIAKKDARLEKDEQDMFVQLGIAHLFGAIAYGILDKISDNQATCPADLIPIALIAHGHCASILTTESRSFANMPKVIRDTFRSMGHAAIWENAETSILLSHGNATVDHIPDHASKKILEKKSLGLSLAPMIALLRQGGSFRDALALQDFIAHYAASRHMHDDVHDWKKDLESERLNSCASICLGIAKRNGTSVTPSGLTMRELAGLISETLASDGMSAIAAKIISCADAGEKIVQKMSSSTPINRNFLLSLIRRFQNGAEKAIKHQEVLEEFCFELNPTV